MSRMPTFYRNPLGLPLRWQDEQSGQLPGAVLAYFSQTATATQTALVCDYLRYYILAPCWDRPVQDDEEGCLELAHVREQADSLNCTEDINTFIETCLQMGIDPL